jgi:glycosyltransferase involved in cell wall biosynthesis
MQGNKYRVLIVSSHPVQYAVPLYRLMARHPKLDILVAYCSLQGAEKGLDPEFGIEIAWDIPLLDGYPWVYVPNRSPRPGLGRFWGLFNPGLWSLIRDKLWDAVYVPGYYQLSHWIAILATKKLRIALIFSTDAHSLISRRVRSQINQQIKKIILKFLWKNLPDAVLAGSTGTVRYLENLGVPSDRIFLAGNVVDNDWWITQAQRADPVTTRAQLKIPLEVPVVLFCAKLQSWKRPQDVLRAFARADVPNSYLIFAGEGPLRKSLEEEAQVLGVAHRVRFIGFVNQSRLPDVYQAADILVLPSEHEPFGVVVNEAMLCGRPVIVSDRVGAKYDLVREGETGFVYPCGDIEALARILREVLPDRERLRKMGEAARKRMETWSPRENVEAFVQAVEKAVQRKRGKKE